MLSILAGIMIGLAGTAYLMIGGIVGAIFFSFGLFTILSFNYHLFTGKAGLLINGGINLKDLFLIWLGNFIGTAGVASVLIFTSVGIKCANVARPIVETRLGNSTFENLLLGVFCGFLMYIAVNGYKEKNNIVFVIAPVTIFIMCGFNHCIADMFYLCIGAYNIKEFGVLIPTTIGNIIGCNLIPYFKKFC